MGVSVGLWPETDGALVPASMFLNAIKPPRRGEPAPKQWRDWLTTLFPKHFYYALGKRHFDFWKWTLDVRLGLRPRPFVGVWPRGSGKSTSAEVGCVALGVRKARKYALYVRETQDQADKSVENIASLLESREIARFYPEHSERKIGKHGNSRGWRRNRVMTSGGFTVDALGLDTAARGLKVEEQRPDLIILDDIDGKFDSPAATAKKIGTITHTILPAGSKDLAVLAIQNLIIPGGVFTQLADGTAEFLVDRVLSGPFPAIEELEYEWRRDPDSGIKRAVITGGRATWEGQSIEACQDQIDTIGLSAFIRECQHDVKRKSKGIVLRLKPEHMLDLSDDECRALLAERTGFGGIDFGAWRFAFVLYAIDGARRAIRIDEYFSQGETLSTRARAIHELCEFYGVVGLLPIWGDAANPQDIMELNDAFRRGWDAEDERTGKPVHVTSKLRVVAVLNENKNRKVAVTRMNDALDTNRLLFRSGIDYEWRLGMTTESDGLQMTGSRLMWEADHWSFPIAKPGEVQDQNPDDDTADGGDMIAAQRYALMSHWKKVKVPPDFGVVDSDRAEKFDYKKRKFVEHPHAVDLLTGPTDRRAPRVQAPRPRIGR